MSARSFIHLEKLEMAGFHEREFVQIPSYILTLYELFGEELAILFQIIQ